MLLAGGRRAREGRRQGGRLTVNRQVLAKGYKERTGTSALRVCSWLLVVPAAAAATAVPAAVGAAAAAAGSLAGVGGHGEFCVWAAGQHTLSGQAHR